MSVLRLCVTCLLHEYRSEEVPDIHTNDSEENLTRVNGRDRSRDEGLHMRKTETVPAGLMAGDEDEEDPPSPPSPLSPSMQPRVNGASRGASTSSVDVPPPTPQSPEAPLHSPRDNGVSAQMSPVLTIPGPPSLAQEEESRKKLRMDRAYYVAKELLTTERTYKKDLEVLCVWLRNAVSTDEVMPEYLMHLMFSHLDPIYEFHCQFLKDVEQRLAVWEGKANAHMSGDNQRIGDVMQSFLAILKLYTTFIDRQEEIMSELEQACRRNKIFEQAYRDFEQQKVCYLPLSSFLLKPAQRLIHYRILLEKLVNHYQEHHANHPDYKDCKASLARIGEVTKAVSGKVQQLENTQKLMELQRDLIGMEGLLQPGREFVREGCLQKLSRRGYQQRMFFLLSDQLIYCSRTATPNLLFKVHGQFPLKGMVIDETDPKLAVANSFTIYAHNRCLLVAAGSSEEKTKWAEELNCSIGEAQERDDDVRSMTLRSNSSSENISDQEGMSGGQGPDKAIGHRANTTMHVCWHRNTSVSARDIANASQNHLSGYLLRKFKNSNGWQKLWVVFTSFCLFFYKSYQDDYPLASLPLLGYAISTPGPEDGISKDFVFKLQFKNHVYFFRAESHYTFERWLEVISCATSSAHLTRLFSRIDSFT